MKKKKNKEIISIFLRYIVLLFVILIIYSSEKIYSLLFSMTIYPVNFILSLFFNSSVNNSSILLDSIVINIIPACVAVSAYVLLFILNFTIQLDLKRRIYSLIFSLFLLLLLNIFRISIFSILFINKFTYFNLLHELFWYFFSIVLVIGIWFLTAYLFKIRSIPIYDDFKCISEQK
jgi:exosortase/archaeosortase family protein